MQGYFALLILIQQAHRNQLVNGIGVGKIQPAAEAFEIDTRLGHQRKISQHILMQIRENIQLEQGPGMGGKGGINELAVYFGSDMLRGVHIEVIGLQLFQNLFRLPHTFFQKGCSQPDQHGITGQGVDDFLDGFLMLRSIRIDMGNELCQIPNAQAADIQTAKRNGCGPFGWIAPGTEQHTAGQLQNGGQEFLFLKYSGVIVIQIGGTIYGIRKRIKVVKDEQCPLVQASQNIHMRFKPVVQVREAVRCGHSGFAQRG